MSGYQLNHRNLTKGIVASCVKVIKTNPIRPIQTTIPFFETMSKIRRGYPSETQVKRGERVIGNGKRL
jgi:hypothetical protein